MVIIIDRLYKHYPAFAVSWDVSIWQPCPIALTNPLLVLDPAGVPVPWAVVHWGPASFCMHRELCTRALLCPCHQHSQWANSKGRWQVWCFFFFFGLFCLFKHLHYILQSPKVSYTVFFFQCFHKVKEYLCLFLFSWKHYYHPCLACAVIIKVPPAS